MSERSYAQFCGVARALDLLGGRWTLLIVRNLLLGPRRYTTLLGELPGITTNLLAARLKALDDAGLATRVDDEGHPAWALTRDGALLEPIVMELGRFGARTLQRPRPGERMDMGWALLSMKRRYRGGLTLEVELRLTGSTPSSAATVASSTTERVFTLTFGDRYLKVHDRPATAPSLVVSGSTDVVRAVFFAGQDPRAAVDSGAIVVAGAPEHWQAFLGAFAPGPLPGTGGADPALTSPPLTLTSV
jgi:DNA-binding HxlR family transcriptional regulator